MKDAKKFWDKSAFKYAKRPIKDEATYQKKLAITQQYLRAEASVLEFGCGTGGTAIAHAPHVKQITATDLSGNMLEIAQQKAKQSGIDNITFLQGSIENLSLETGSFDVVLGMNILHLVDGVNATLHTVNQYLKPGGVFVSSTSLIREVNILWKTLITVMQRLGFAPHVNHLSQRTLLKRLQQAGFTIEQQWQPNKHSAFIVAKKTNAI